MDSRPELVDHFQAFRLESVVDNFGRRIESVCTWGQRVIVGLGDGTLLMFERQEQSGPPSASQPAWQVVFAQKAFSRRPVQQMQASVQHSVLISLTDDGVSFHKLPACTLVCTAPRSRSATCFAWHDERQLLAFAVKRRLNVHQLQGRALQEQAEQALPHSPKALAWAADGSCLFAGFKSQYLKVEPFYDSFTEMISLTTGTLPTVALAMCPTGEVMLCRCALASRARWRTNARMYRACRGARPPWLQQAHAGSNGACFVCTRAAGRFKLSPHVRAVTFQLYPR